MTALVLTARHRRQGDEPEGPLAVSSAAGAIRRLGGTRWQWLRRLVYVIGLWPTEPTRCRPVFPSALSYWGKGASAASLLLRPRDQ